MECHSKLFGCAGSWPEITTGNILKGYKFKGLGEMGDL